MTARAKQEQSVVTNLEDAGCDIGLIEQFMDLMKTGKKEAGLRFPLTSWNPSSRTICNYTRRQKNSQLSPPPEVGETTKNKKSFDKFMRFPV